MGLLLISKDILVCSLYTIKNRRRSISRIPFSENKNTRRIWETNNGPEENFTCKQRREAAPQPRSRVANIHHALHQYSPYAMCDGRLHSLASVRRSAKARRHLHLSCHHHHHPPSPLARLWFSFASHSSGRSHTPTRADSLYHLVVQREASARARQQRRRARASGPAAGSRISQTSCGYWGFAWYAPIWLPAGIKRIRRVSVAELRAGGVKERRRFLSGRMKVCVQTLLV
ncbi:hypothetical protein V8C42DRAFT_320780 [Trichoderma barbatum]